MIISPILACQFRSFQNQIILTLETNAEKLYGRYYRECQSGYEDEFLIGSPNHIHVPGLLLRTPIHPESQILRQPPSLYQNRIPQIIKNSTKEILYSIIDRRDLKYLHSTVPIHSFEHFAPQTTHYLPELAPNLTLPSYLGSYQYRSVGYLPWTKQASNPITKRHLKKNVVEYLSETDHEMIRTFLTIPDSDLILYEISKAPPNRFETKWNIDYLSYHVQKLIDLCEIENTPDPIGAKITRTFESTGNIRTRIPNRSNRTHSCYDS